MGDWAGLGTNLHCIAQWEPTTLPQCLPSKVSTPEMVTPPLFSQAAPLLFWSVGCSPFLRISQAPPAQLVMREPPISNLQLIATPSSVLIPLNSHSSHFSPSVHQYFSFEVGDFYPFHQLTIQWLIVAFLLSTSFQYRPTDQPIYEATNADASENIRGRIRTNKKQFFSAHIQ